ncbi:MAG: trigger factor [Ktedonobacterales bacterium]
MKVTVDRSTESEAVLNVELEWSEVEKASDKAYHRLAQKYTVPGFRKGHAPRSMLERMLGKETIYQEGLEDLIETTYREAVRSNDLNPLGRPDVDAPGIEMGQPYTYVAHVPVQPPVELGDYHGLRVKRPSSDVSDQEVADLLERVRQEQAMWLPAERPAQMGDKITVDLKLTVGDRTISDLKDNEFELASERAGIFSGMDQNLVGLVEGDSKEFSATVPSDYANSELAGQAAHYSVTIKAVKYRELPELDDELAKSVGEYETIDDLRNAVRTQLQTQKESEARRELRESVVKAVTDESKVDVHPVLVHEEVDVMLDETKRMLEQSRLSFEQYLAMTQKSEEQHREEIEPEARERAKRDLVLDAVATAEDIQVTDDEVAGWLELYAAMGGRRLTPKSITPGQRANIVTRLRRDKTISHLVEIATKNDENQTLEEVEEARATGAEAEASPTAEIVEADSGTEAEASETKQAKAPSKVESVTKREKTTAQTSDAKQDL